MGGECNYLLRVSRCPERRLEFVPDGEWKSAIMQSWSEPDIQSVLDAAGTALLETADHLRLPVQVSSWQPGRGVGGATGACKVAVEWACNSDRQHRTPKDGALPPLVSAWYCRVWRLVSSGA